MVGPAAGRYADGHEQSPLLISRAAAPAIAKGLAMQICIRSFVVAIDAPMLPGGIKPVTREFAIRLDAEAALTALMGRYPEAGIRTLKTYYDLTDATDLREYEAHIARLYATCVTSGVWEELGQADART